MGFAGMDQKPSLIDEIRRPRNIKDQAADRVAKIVGSWSFLITQSCLLCSWVVVNVLWDSGWDAYPFILMNLVLSLQAAYTAPVIMMSQNRQGKIDRNDAQLDYETNRITSYRVLQILERVEGNARDISDLRRLVNESLGHPPEKLVEHRYIPILIVPPPGSDNSFE